MSASACFISSTDSWWMCFASLPRPQFSHIRECRKYWLIAVSSLRRTLFRCAMTLGSPFMAPP